jgi:hypothetical protein
VTVRAVLYEEEHARRVVERLRGNGFEADVARDRLAGEDDDEDHPWLVLTDAPSFMVEVLVDAYDGWVDDSPPGPPPRPLDLPDAPRRVKGHFREP